MTVRGSVRTVALAAVLVVAAACSSSPATEVSTSESSSLAGSATSTSSADETSVAEETAPPTESATAVTDGLTAEPAPSEQPGDPTAPTARGDINATVPQGTLTSLPPVPADQPVEIVGDVVGSIVGIERVTVQGRLPGEMTGPGLKITVKIDNGTASPLRVDSSTVTLEDSEMSPAPPISADDAKPLDGTIAAGQSAQGVYLFGFPEPMSGPVTITVNYSPDRPVAVFTANP